jgi:transcription antitermination factor NusA-like protein
LAFWGTPNLQVINREVHIDKCAREAGQRARVRRDVDTAGSTRDRPG